MSSRTTAGSPRLATSACTGARLSAKARSTAARASLVERALEPEARHLVERGARCGERGDAAGEGRREDAGPGVPARSRRSAVGEQAALRPLDAGREGRAGEEHGAVAAS